jgi:hypothetical protein|nr:MAG TPA: hypothetical protein [Caudoviricetes sp.]
MVTIYDQPLLVIRNGEIRTEAYWKITIPGTVVLVSGQRFMFLSSDNTRDGFWLVLGEQTQLTVQEFYDKFEMEPVVVVIDTTN